MSQVYGSGVPLLRLTLMAPEFLSYIWTLKDLRVLGNQMYMMIGLLSTMKHTPVLYYNFHVRMWQ
jgi:hypothetical protein